MPRKRPGRLPIAVKPAVGDIVGVSGTQRMRLFRVTWASEPGGLFRAQCLAGGESLELGWAQLRQPDADAMARLEAK